MQRLRTAALAAAVIFGLGTVVAEGRVSPPVLPQPPPNTQAYTSATDVTSSRVMAATTIAVASNGATLPTGTIAVANATLFPSSGYVLIQGNAAGDPPNRLVSYTSSDATHLYGCTGGTGTISTGQVVIVAYIAGASRRMVIAKVGVGVNATGDSSFVLPVYQGASRIIKGGQIGIESSPQNFAGMGGLSIDLPIVMVVDPNGPYGLWPTTTGTGHSAMGSWIEVDS